MKGPAPTFAEHVFVRYTPALCPATIRWSRMSPVLYDMSAGQYAAGAVRVTWTLRRLRILMPRRCFVLPVLTAAAPAMLPSCAMAMGPWVEGRSALVRL